MSARYEIVRAEPKHLRLLARSAKGRDLAACQAVGLATINELWRWWSTSHIRLAAIVDGEVAAVGGCAGGLLSPEGQPWMLTGPAIERVPLAFVREVRAEVGRMFEAHPTLRGYVRVSFRRAVRFLKLVGFEMRPAERFLPHEAAAYGLDREPFLEFKMER